MKSGLKTAVRKFREAADAGDKDQPSSSAATQPQARQGRLKGVIHKNQAANRKSAIGKRINSAA